MKIKVILENIKKYKSMLIVFIFFYLIIFKPVAFAGDATLSWDPPVTNTDGSPLTDLAGYKLYYGTTSGNYSNNIDAGNITTYQINNLTDGLTYYFAAAAYDTSGNESSFSNEVSKTIASPPPPPAPEITVTDSTSPVDDLHVLFGGVIVGYSSNQTVTVKNNGNVSLDIGNIAQANPVALPYSIINNNCSGQSIAPSATCTFTICFLPTAAGSFSDSLDIPSNDSDENPVIITVSGTGVINNPPIVSTGGPYTGIEGQAITLNASGSSDSDGSIALYEWDINNDGTYDYTSSSSTRTHTYAQQGAYTIKLRVTDNLGATTVATTTTTISDTSPTANFTGSPTSGAIPITVNFVNSSTGYDQPLSYKWDFDNNGTIDSTAQNPSYTYTAQGTYTVKLTVTDFDGSSNVLTKVNYITVTTNKNLSCNDGGTIECVERTDNGSDSDNLVNSKARLDYIEYRFKITIVDTSGTAPQYVKLFMTQRINPTPADFYTYYMSCTGSYTTGGLCVYITKLGPAPVHKFYFEAKMADSTILRYPSTGYITGPNVQQLNGFSLMGAPRDIFGYTIDSYTAFASNLTYRWNAGMGYYTQVTTLKPLKTGEGYFVYKEANNLPDLDGYGEVPNVEFTYELKPGWNIISNPYSGNVNVLNIKVKKGNASPLTWVDAALNGWLTNAIYSYNGVDWGNTYGFDTEPYATLVPWMGYWINLKMTDDIYYLVIPKPLEKEREWEYI